MLAVLLASVAVVGQGVGGKVDGIEARRIFEAARAADSWVFLQVHVRLVPDARLVTSLGKTRSSIEALQESCRRDLTNAAYEQICDAYHVSRKQFNAIVRNPAQTLSFEHVPEFHVRRRWNRQLEPWERAGTRFDPKGVRLKESLAKKYGYINPRKPEPLPPSLVLEQLIGPSPVPKQFTEPKAKAVEPSAVPDWFNGSPEAWAAHEKRRREFTKRTGLRDYRVPGGSPLD